jgi:hypothetical protein
MTSMCTHTQCKRDLLQCKRDLLAHDQQVYTHTVKICGNKACETSSSSTCLLFGISTSSISHMYLKKKMLFEILSSSSRLMYATRTCATPPHTHTQSHTKTHTQTHTSIHTHATGSEDAHTHTHTHTPTDSEDYCAGRQVGRRRRPQPSRGRPRKRARTDEVPHPTGYICSFAVFEA